LKTASIEADDHVPPTESDIDASRHILSDVYSECCSALNIYLSDSQNVGLMELSRFFKCAYELGRSKSAGVFKELSEEIPKTVAREREEARVQGAVEGKRAERLRWIEDGHVGGKECKAIRHERMSIAVKTDPEPPSTPIAPPSTSTTAIQTEPVIDKPVSLNWAEEMSAVPIHHVLTAPHSASPATGRDISVLCSSESIRPFASLQHCHVLMRHMHPCRSSQPSKVKYPFSKLLSCTSQPSLPSSHESPPHFSSQPRSRYNWASNLFVLSDLAIALGNMGWRPPGFFCPRF
jgi:hypothetical protein